MWLKKLEVKNFKSIGDISIDFTPGVNIIFGENGAGKTNIIKSILKILGPNFPSHGSFLKEDYFCFDDSKRLKINFEFVDKENLITLSWDKNFANQKFDLLVNEKNHINVDMRLQFCPLHIPPNRTIKDVPGTSRSTPLGRIIFELAKMIEKNKTLYEDYQNKMSECVKILERSDEFSQFKQDVEKYSSEQIGQRGERIDIKLDLLDHKHILKTLQIFEMIGNEQCNLSDGGPGIQSNVTIAAIRAFSSLYHGGYYIVADEPEAYLHPLAQRALCSIFEEIAKNGTQIIITTHSPHFISQNYLDGLIRVWMKNNRTKCKKIDLDLLLKNK